MRTFWLLQRQNYNFFVDEMEEELLTDVEDGESENYDPEIFPRPSAVRTKRKPQPQPQNLSSWSKSK